MVQRLQNTPADVKRFASTLIEALSAIFKANGTYFFIVKMTHSLGL